MARYIFFINDHFRESLDNLRAFTALTQSIRHRLNRDIWPKHPKDASLRGYRPPFIKHIFPKKLCAD